jgi:LPXTG-site transpeptidase (sortase) family protein
VTVTVVNLPAAVNDTATTNEGTPVTTSVLTNDDLGTEPTTITANTQGTNGTVSCTATQCTYTPNAGFTGTDTYTYTITDANGNPSTATVTVIVDQALLGISKRVVGTTEVSTGTWDVTYAFYIENFGTVTVSQLQVVDDLTAAFPLPTTFTVQSISSTQFTENSAYNGSSDTNLLTGDDSLNSGQSGTITLIVRIVPASGGPFENVATASGIDPRERTVSDASQDGTDPDPDGDGDPTNNSDPTPLNLGPNLFDPPFGVKTFDASGLPVLKWTMTWINNSNIVAVNAQVSDPIVSGTTYAGGVTCTASGSSSTSLCSFEPASAAYPQGRVIWSGSIGPDSGATDAASAANEVVISFSVTVDSGRNSVQNVATIDSDLNGDGDLTDPGEQNTASASSTWTAQARKNPTTLPATGFAPNMVTDLTHVPHETYLATGDVMLEIPSLGVKIPVVGVPKKNDTWNVSWLGNQAGWLAGSAFPSWNGNSILTGHVYLADGLPGPFVSLYKLKYGDRIIVHAYGQKYTFAVQTNAVVDPANTSVMKHEEKPWLTMVTCKDYDEKSGSYRNRVVVRAVLVRVDPE